MDLVTFKNHAFYVEWWIDLESHMEFVGFFFLQHSLTRQKIDKTTKEMSVVTRNDWVCVCQNVKNQCIFTTKGLITKLDK